MRRGATRGRRRAITRHGLVAWTVAVGLGGCAEHAPRPEGGRAARVPGAPTPSARDAFRIATAAARRGDAVTGTYAFAVCRGGRACRVDAPDGAYAAGTLVLLPAADAARHGVPDAEWEGAANGCFRVALRRDPGHTYLGLTPAGGVVWRRDATGAFAVHLYRSPDAGYELRAVVLADTLVGVGASWGAGAAAIVAPDDHVVGRRTGPPDPTACRLDAAR